MRWNKDQSTTHQLSAFFRVIMTEVLRGNLPTNLTKPFFQFFNFQKKINLVPHINYTPASDRSCMKKM